MNLNIVNLKWVTNGKNVKKAYEKIVCLEWNNMKQSEVFIYYGELLLELLKIFLNQAGDIKW